MPFNHVAANVRICQKPPSNDGFSSARGMTDIGDFPATQLSGLERSKAAGTWCHNRSVVTPCVAVAMLDRLVVGSNGTSASFRSV